MKDKKKLFAEKLKQLNPVNRFKAIDGFRQIYNSLCDKCRVSMFMLGKRKANTIDLKKLCDKCRPMAEKKLKEINELLAGG